MYLLKTIMAIAAFCFTAFVHAEVNINTATIPQLMELDNIGSVKAAAIVEYRNEHGRFRNVDDLLKVSGVGLAILEANRNKLTVGINQDEASPAEQTMPMEKSLMPKVTSSKADKES